MKTILKEWRSFLKESNKPYQIHSTSIAGRGIKYLSNLQRRTDITKQEALRIEAAYYIVSALDGHQGNKKFFKKNRSVVLNVLDSLYKLVSQFVTTNQNVSDDLFGIYATGAQREKTGSREKINSVAYILEFKDLAAHNVDFYAEEDLVKYVEAMSAMVENKDYDFGIFKKPEERKKFFDTKKRSHDQDTGGLRPPPGLSPQEWKELDAVGHPYFMAMRDHLDRHKRRTERERLEIKLKVSETESVFLNYLYELWLTKTDPNKYRNRTMIRMYKVGAEKARVRADMTKVELRLLGPEPPTPEEKVELSPEEKIEDLMAKARAGDKEAAKQAREIAYKEMTELQKYNDPKDRKRIDDLKKIAREMRRLSKPSR